MRSKTVYRLDPEDFIAPLSPKEVRQVVVNDSTWSKAWAVFADSIMHPFSTTVFVVQPTAQQNGSASGAK